MTQADLFSAAALRDKALAQVRANNPTWLDRALKMVRRRPHGEIITGEALRVALTQAGLPAPGHHNAWGAMIRTAAKRGLLIPTGTYVHMEGKKSHARMTPQYRIRVP